MTGKGIPAWVIGEFVGTFLLVFFGCGSVCSALVTNAGATLGLFEVALLWGLGVTTAIYLTAALSGAHLNPAVTISLAVWGGFPKRRVPGYIATQIFAAFVSAALLYVIFGGALTDFETRHHLTRGAAGSEASAMVFGEYYPNPGGKPLTESSPLPTWRAFTAEAIGTAILLLVIFGTTDLANKDRPQILIAPAIGLTITLLVCLLGPLTMACLNPARDLGPRLFASAAGWGAVPFTANGSGWLTVYIVAPIVGGLIGGGFYRAFLQGNYRRSRHPVIVEENRN